MQYAMELFARAHQADLLRDARAQRLSRGRGWGSREAARPQPRRPEPRHHSPR
jgi:hypothetical protein